MSQSSVRVGTFNIKVSVDSHLAEVASELCRLNLDLCALQEVGCHWSLGTSLAQHQYLAHAQDHSEAIYAPLLERNWSLDPYRGGPFSFYETTISCDQVFLGRRGREAKYGEGCGYYGIALTARGEVESHQMIRLPKELDEPRAFIYTLWQPDPSDLQALHVITTHLSIYEAERVQQAQVIRKMIDSLDGPLLLLGDLNDIPCSETLEILMLDGGLVDLAPLSLQSQETFSVKQPHRRIDYLLGRGLSVLQYHVDLACTSSDHFPVWAEVKW